MCFICWKIAQILKGKIGKANQQVVHLHKNNRDSNWKQHMLEAFPEYRSPGDPINARAERKLATHKCCCWYHRHVIRTCFFSRRFLRKCDSKMFRNHFDSAWNASKLTIFKSSMWMCEIRWVLYFEIQKFFGIQWIRSQWPMDHWTNVLRQSLIPNTISCGESNRCPWSFWTR